MSKDDISEQALEQWKQTQSPYNSSSTYAHREFCNNCCASNTMDVPKGTRIEDFTRDKKCWKCGCMLHEPRVRLTNEWMVSHD